MTASPASPAQRTTFSFAPPVDDAAAWALEPDDFANRLLQAFPDAETWSEGAAGPLSRGGLGLGLGFELPLDGGDRLEGLVSNPFPEVGVVMAVHATAREAAVLARWLRDHYAPSPDLVHFTSEWALERDFTQYGCVPATGGLSDIARVLQAHLDEVADCA
ncbi:hypothetical protein ACFV6E_40960 [Streptomyces sp. NPDC059785]|uniref:hypothetical protein n=1 Tax=Streptomyces sp. NPDC059785 TaxID=3346945 RepID=UPI00364FF21D